MFGQFGGESCQSSLGDRESCITNAKCQLPPPPVCTGTEFQCESGISASFKSRAKYFSRYYFRPNQFKTLLYTGSCINKRLMCNGDHDCEDGSDEDCEPVQKPCGSAVLDSNEQGRTAGYG